MTDTTYIEGEAVWDHGGREGGVDLRQHHSHYTRRHDNEQVTEPSMAMLVVWLLSA